MEERLDAWLKTYRAEKFISPVDWESIPEECRIRLDNFARDEAVHRADAFAHDGQLDLRRQEAVRQLVDAMAQSWRLPGDDVRHVVEDFYDALPPKPGHEFDKLAVRLFRRRVNASAADVFNQFDPTEEHPVIEACIKYLDVPPNKMLDRGGFLRAFQNAYDTWTTKQSRDAVLEILQTTGLTTEPIKLSDLLPYLENRGARTWAKALMLEQDIGVDVASRDEIIRILKRYALMVKRGGPEAIGLSAPPPIPDAISEDAAPIPESDLSASDEQSPAIEPDLEPEPQIAEEPEPELEDVPVSEDEPFVDDTTNDDDLAASSADYPPPVDETTADESENIHDDEEEFDPGLESEEPAEELLEEEQPVDSKMVGTAPEEVRGEEQPEAVHEFTPDESTDDTVTTESDQQGEPHDMDPNRFHVRDLDDLDDDDLEAIEYLFGKDVIEYDDDEDDSGEDDDDEGPTPAVGTVNGMTSRSVPQVKELRDVEHGQPVQIAEKPRPQKDRFASLRSGDLRGDVVREIFANDAAQFDRFLAKLTSAADWKSGKKIIAEEMLDRRVNLEQEPARALFFALKDCMTGS
ncbi:hypothetical protein KQI52_01700 [bacterium]|nr:hypothetical protein [bacterium]